MDCVFLTKNEVARKARISRRFLDMRIAAGTGPQVVHIDRRALVRSSDLAAWLDSLTTPPQRKPAPAASEAAAQQVQA